jgi:hypothetical protein
VPALFTWVGSGSGSGAEFDTLTNWTQDGGAATRIPAAGDDLHFMSSLSGNCADMHGPSSGAYASVNLVGGYASTVTLESGFTTETLTMTAAGAAFSQPASGTDITVTEEFQWTRGTLNSSSYLSTLILDGATANIAPASTMGFPPPPGTVYLGSNITLTNGTVATMREGTIEITNEGMEIDVGDDCQMNVDPGTGKKTEITGDVETGETLKIRETGAVRVLSGSFPLKGQVENDGEFTLKAGTTASIEWNGNVGFTKAYFQGAGVTQLYDGSLLETTGTNVDVVFFGGKLMTVGGDATIKGDLRVTGTTEILINSGPNETASYHIYGTLTIDGDVSWEAGTYRPRVPAEHNQGQADLWYATGTFSASGIGPQIVPVALDDEQAEVPPDSEDSWLVIKANGGLTSNNNAPHYDTNIWILETAGINPVTEWWMTAL